MTWTWSVKCSMTEPAHAPTRVTGTATFNGAKVTYDYVGCTVCRIDHPIIGRVAQPWHKAHPEPLPPTAGTPVPDGSQVRQ